MKRKPPLLDKGYKRHRFLSDEEKILWLEATETVQHPNPEPQANIRIIPSKLKADKNRAIKTGKSKKAAPAPVPALDKDTFAKITKGTLRIQAKLDLHGYTRETAYHALIDFIYKLQSDGVRSALIITGKGRGNTEGTLRELLPRWLNESPLRQHIIAYDNAALRHGGSGAWYIRIRKQK